MSVPVVSPWFPSSSGSSCRSISEQFINSAGKMIRLRHKNLHKSCSDQQITQISYDNHNDLTGICGKESGRECLTPCQCVVKCIISVHHLPFLCSFLCMTFSTSKRVVRGQALSQNSEAVLRELSTYIILWNMGHISSFQSKCYFTACRLNLPLRESRIT